MIKTVHNPILLNRETFYLNALHSFYDPKLTAPVLPSAKRFLCFLRNIMQGKKGRVMLWKLVKLYVSVETSCGKKKKQIYRDLKPFVSKTAPKMLYCERIRQHLPGLIFYRHLDDNKIYVENIMQ